MKIEISLTTETARDVTLKELRVLDLDWERAYWDEDVIIVEGGKWDIVGLCYFLDEREISWTEK